MSVNRFVGCLVGIACGDALGGPVEEIPGHLSKLPKPVTEMVGGGHFNLLPGQITDDTEMALCLARSLIEKHGFDPIDIAQRFQEWFFDSPIGAGGTVRAAMERLRSGEPWNLAGFSETGRKSLGNGSVMRCAPIAMFSCFAGKQALTQYNFQQGIITHPHEECVYAVEFINAITAYLLKAEEPSKEMLTRAMSRGELSIHGPRAAYAFALKAIPEYMQEKYKDIAKLEKVNPFGSVHNTVTASVNCLLTTNTFEDAIVKAANLGGDADTIAAITGAMAGAWYGIEAIPTRWSIKLVDRHCRPVLSELTQLAEKLHQLAIEQ